MLQSITRFYKLGGSYFIRIPKSLIDDSKFFMNVNDKVFIEIEPETKRLICRIIPKDEGDSNNNQL